MMKKLELIDEDPWEVFVAIRNEKKKGRRALLKALEDRVRQRYQDYARHARSLEHLPPAQPPFDPKNEGKVLNHCYKVSTTPLKRLKQRIKERQSPIAQSKCQYCGIDSPGTFDHYLPRDVRGGFPEFAVYAPNLLPSCHTCNNLRGTGWIEGGERTCLHLYFDRIEDKERILFADIEPDKRGRPTASFWVEPERGANHEAGWRYERHFSKLGLGERFREAAPARLESLQIDIRNQYCKDIDTLLGYLASIAADSLRSFGANNWEVALLHAAAESRWFVENCLRDPERIG